jgi:hypothetical protein
MAVSGRRDDTTQIGACGPSLRVSPRPHHVAQSCERVSPVPPITSAAAQVLQRAVGRSTYQENRSLSLDTPAASSRPLPCSQSG